MDKRVGRFLWIKVYHCAITNNPKAECYQNFVITNIYLLTAGRSFCIIKREALETKGVHRYEKTNGKGERIHRVDVVARKQRGDLLFARDPAVDLGGVLGLAWLLSAGSQGRPYGSEFALSDAVGDRICRHAAGSTWRFGAGGSRTGRETGMRERLKTGTRI